MRQRWAPVVARWAALAGLLAALPGLTACATAESVVPGVPEPSHGSMVISAGNATGVYYAWSIELARQLRATDPRMKVTVLASDGSVMNLDRLRDGQADLALTTVDATEPTLGSTLGPTAVDAADARRSVPLRALGRIYDDYVQVVVRADSGLHSVADLAGLRVAVNTPGSGTALVARRVLDAAGITVRESTLGVADGTRALEERKVDAVFWSGGIPTPSIAVTAERVKLRLLPLGDLAGRLRADYGAVYRPATIPPGRYRSTEEVATVASPNLLVARADADPQMVTAVLSTIFGRRDAIADAVPAANGTDVRTAIWTGSLPLHPAAVAFYRRTKP